MKDSKKLPAVSVSSPASTRRLREVAGCGHDSHDSESGRICWQD